MREYSKRESAREYMHEYMHEYRKGKKHTERFQKYMARYKKTTKAVIAKNQRKKTVNDKTRNRLNQGKPWEEHEITMLWNTSLTTHEIADKLGRSHTAVITARARYSVKKPDGYIHNGCQKVVFPEQKA
jgi:hypothetical protein